MTAEVEQVFDPEAGPARGLLKPPPQEGKFRHSRRNPSPDLACFIEHYWTVSLDLRGLEPYMTETLPHPNVQVVFEEGKSAVAGVQTSKFTRLLEGRSQVFGIKFKPGGFYPFLKASVSSLTDCTVPVNSIFGTDADALETVLLSPCEEDEKLKAANEFFHACIPEPDKTIGLAGQLVTRIFQEADIKTVDDLVSRTGIGKRSLQRIFNEYVGISPKWVIRRYRLHELVERIKSGESLDWVNLALELGYFDQSHLINDFRSIIGYSPIRYQKQVLKNL
jgi:AraC-like DNA-binding protein